MSEFELTILGRPPSWNSAYRARNSYIYMTREVKNWKEMVTILAQSARQTQQWSCKPDTMLIVDLWIHVNRSMDADNILKLTLDAVAEGIGVNDARFLPRVWELKKKCDEERIVIKIREEVNT